MYSYSWVELTLGDCMLTREYLRDHFLYSIFFSNDFYVYILPCMYNYVICLRSSAFSLRYRSVIGYQHLVQTRFLYQLEANSHLQSILCL